jgi:hypothetical protein
MDAKSCKKKNIDYHCEICDYSIARKSSFDKHLLSTRHTNRTLLNNIEQKSCDVDNLVCKTCNKIYKARNSLWYHLQKCKPIEDSSQTDKPEDVKNLTTIVIELIKSNNELQKQVLEVCKNGSTINSYNNNSNNKTFNLQFFLNEQCKDAMNISEFVKTFDLQLSDLESVGELGYVEGITKIMIDKLNSMDIYKRPIHCSDAKREIMYVKDEDKWEKEGRNNPKLRHAIKTVSFQNMKLANLWSNTYPESKNNESHLNDTYMKLIRQSTGGSGDIGNSEDKIIRRIAKEVIIGKL